MWKDKIVGFCEKVDIFNPIVVTFQLSCTIIIYSQRIHFFDIKFYFRLCSNCNYGVCFNGRDAKWSIHGRAKSHSTADHADAMSITIANANRPCTLKTPALGVCHRVTVFDHSRSFSFLLRCVFTWCTLEPKPHDCIGQATGSLHATAC